MKYKSFSILFLAVFWSLGHMAFSADETGSMEDDATWWSQDVSEIAVMGRFDGVEAELTKLTEEEKRLTIIEELFRESQKDFQYDASKQKILLENMQAMQRELKKNIQKSEEELANIEKEIQLNEQEIARIKSRQVDTALFIRKTFAEKYKNNIQAKTNSGLSSLLFGPSVGNMLAKNDSAAAIQGSIENLLSHQRSLQENLETLKEALNQKILVKKHFTEGLIKERRDLKETQEVEQNALGSMNQKQENISEKISNVTTKKLEVQAKIIAKKTENNAQFETKFSEYERIIKESFAQYNCNSIKTAACIWMDKYIAMEKEMLSKGNELQTFVWPLVPNNGFGYHFRDQKYFTANEIHHEGLDILTPAGIQIQAIADGYILIKKEASGTSPGIVIVKHANGLMSVYVGINPNGKSMFSAVSAGDSIGTSQTYTDHSGQNNIHIELYERGKLIDPLDKLDLSSVKIENIPPRYGWKYVDDMKKMNNQVNLESLQKAIGFFYIEWGSEAARQKKFLEKYAASDFQDRSLWINESLPESIDPTFVMCVGFAESTLGKNLTTSGNIGNVGNTDSGARRDYNDPRSGIRAIAAVVNNNWLGGYNTVDQLSGWGNPKWPIYASSQTNWHENIVKCMSAMKQKYVWNTSNFRLSQASFLLYQQEGFTARRDS